MSTIRLYYGRDNDEMIRRLKEAQQGKFEVNTLEVRETVLDEHVIKEIVNLVMKNSIETVQLDDCGAYLNKQAIRMAQALGKVKNVRLSEPTFLSQFFLDRLLMQTDATLNNLRIQGHLHQEQLEALSKGLEATTSLTTLDLSRSRIDNFAVLAEGLKSNSSLRTLRLRSLGLRDENVKTILDALQDHPTLTSLDLSFNHIQHMDHVARFIETSNNITDLQLGYQNIWQAPTVDISGLAQVLTRNKSIKNLSLARNKLCDKDAKLLAAALLRNSSLENLNLRENKFSDLGIVFLANALEVSIRLRECSLVKNSPNPGILGLEALLKAAKINHSLFNIGLTNNGSTTQQIFYETALNRGGRKLLFENPPVSLWPLALERVNKIDFLDESHNIFEASGDCYRLDALFNMLKGPVLFEGSICKSI